MKLKKHKKLFLIISLAVFIVLLFNSNTIFAAINTEYSGVSNVPATGLNDAMNESSLLGNLAKLIYALGRLIEWLLGVIFKLLTGVEDFPWADKIVFNSVPLLDINFINPDEDSFVIAIREVLQNTYTTILTLAASFFGIVVLITSIKLVISTIASDKAKYKQAIVDWLVGFIMLFCMHYAISFIFYLNEQLVIVASNVAKGALNDSGKKAEVGSTAVVNNIIDNVKRKGTTINGKSVAKILQENISITSEWVNMESDDNTTGVHEAALKDIGADKTNDHVISEERQYKMMGAMILWAKETKWTVKQLQELKKQIVVVATQPANYNYHNDDGEYYRPKGNCATAGNAKTTAILSGHGEYSYCWDLSPTSSAIYGRDTAGQGLPSSTVMSLFEGVFPQDPGYTGNDGVSYLDITRELFGESKIALVYPENVNMEGVRLAFSARNDKAYDDYPNDGFPGYIDEKPGQSIPGYNALVNSGYYITAWAGGPYDIWTPSEEYLDEMPNLYGFWLTRGAELYTNKFSSKNLYYMTSWTWSSFIDDLIRLRSVGTGEAEAQSAGSRLITDLASYFRYNAYGKTIGEHNKTHLANDDNAQIQNMIMYAVLVVQSLILFIAYIKRLFYVVILALMSPVVIVFDFFQKFGK